MQQVIRVLSEWAEFCYKCTDFYHPGDDGGLVWNDPAIGITWPDVTGEYPGNGSSSGYHMSDGTPLNILERDENWPTLANLEQQKSRNLLGHKKISTFSLCNLIKSIPTLLKENLSVSDSLDD